MTVSLACRWSVVASEAEPVRAMNKKEKKKEKKKKKKKHRKEREVHRAQWQRARTGRLKLNVSGEEEDGEKYSFI